jgi:dephospho-CoA kinase
LSYSSLFHFYNAIFHPKAVDRTVEIAGRFGGKNITDFLATDRNEMQQRHVNDLKQISSLKRVVELGVRERIMEIQNERATWAKFEKALLADTCLKMLQG